MKLKVAAWVAAAVVGTLVVLTIAAAAGSRTEPLRKLVVATLEDRLDSRVELKAFSVDLFPAVTVQGVGTDAPAPNGDGSGRSSAHRRSRASPSTAASSTCCAARAASST